MMEFKDALTMYGVRYVKAYLTCSPAIRSGVRDLLDVLDDPKTSDADKTITLHTIRDALFPNEHQEL